MVVKRAAKTIASGLHASLASGPRYFAQAYIELLSGLSRAALPEPIATRVCNSIAGHNWPPMQFTAREVVVGNSTKIRLEPHLGEFDEAALFAKRLRYEQASFKWLEANAANDYDIIIEIGANVGVFTVFFDALAREGLRLKEVIAFEPSRQAYARLLSNLKANSATTVTPFNAAVGTSSGFQTFYEPEGHLTNGSFLREFSESFSKTVRPVSVLTVSAAELEVFLERAKRALIKIDVEGFEPQLIQAMSGLIEKYRPDLLIEVLSGTAERLERIEALSGYARRLVTTDGPKNYERLQSSETDRDWLLTSN